MNETAKQSKNFESPELLKYKLEVAKRDSKKNIIIAILVSGIIAFVAGYIISGFSNSTVNALTSNNAKLRAENSTLVEENSSLKALNQEEK